MSDNGNVNKCVSAALAPAPNLQNSADQQYSTLEVDHNRCVEHDTNSAPILGQDPKHEKEFDPYNRDSKDGKMMNYSDVSKEVAMVDVKEVLDGSSPPSSAAAPERKILGLKRKLFFIILAAAIVVIAVIAVGAGLGASKASKSKHKSSASSAQTGPSNATTPSNTTSQTPTSVRGGYGNTGLAAMQWTDLNYTLHKRVYYQDTSNKIHESAWDNSTDIKAAWTDQAISDAVKPNTPISAAAGWPHASYNYTLVRNVYYLSNTNNEIIERQSSASAPTSWEDDNFTGLYSASNATYLTAYWNQNIANVSQELVVLYQSGNYANGITQARYISNSTTSSPWVTNNFGFAQPKGNAFAMSLVSYRSGKHLMMYTVDDSKKLQQHEYTISDTVFDPNTVVALTSESPTGLNVDPHAPLAIIAQDNQPLYGDISHLPECTHNTPLTNLIIYTTDASRSSLSLSAWNCTSGFVDQSADLKPLQKANATFLSLAGMSERATGNGSLYVMFDVGRGPQVEEWAVPKHAGDLWVTSRPVQVNFGL